MLFAQREVFVSYSERDLYQIQHALEQAGIDYSIRQRDIRLQLHQLIQPLLLDGLRYRILQILCPPGALLLGIGKSPEPLEAVLLHK